MVNTPLPPPVATITTTTITTTTRNTTITTTMKEVLPLPALADLVLMKVLAVPVAQEDSVVPTEVLVLTAVPVALAALVVLMAVLAVPAILVVVVYHQGAMGTKCHRMGTLSNSPRGTSPQI